MNPYDEFSLLDPALRDAVLYELEMLHQVPPPLEPIPRQPTYYARTEARQTLPERSPLTPLIVESTLEPIPSPPEAAPLTPRASGKQLLWIALLVLVLVGASVALVPKSQPVPTLTASQALKRIAQLDESQYATAYEYRTWANSACSTAAMTEVINAYEALGSAHTFHRITDILSVESSEGQITPDLGLLYGLTSIQRTVGPFHFKAKALQPATISNMIQTARAGQPIIVGFRDPSWFPTGHILLVRGGDAKTISMVDSSRLNIKSLTYSQFQHFWTGFAVLVEPQ